MIMWRRISVSARNQRRLSAGENIGEAKRNENNRRNGAASKRNDEKINGIIRNISEMTKKRNQKEAAASGENVSK